MSTRTCRDCGLSRRPAPHPGPRCATCHRTEKRRRSDAAHERRVQQTYGLQPGEYQRLLLLQGGVCAICGPTTGNRGRSKRLAVDHDHATDEVRGLLCSVCNNFLGHVRDDADAFRRGADYLDRPPYKRL